MTNNNVLNLIKELIQKMGLEVASISLEDENPLNKKGILWFSIEVSNPHIFLGRGGEALSALNYIVKKIIDSKTKEEDQEKTAEFLIDINGFQKKRIENLHTIAYMMAERARYFKSSVKIDPMSAFERRVIHEFLSNAQDLKTESEGVGSGRRVVIKYIGTI